MGDVIPFETLVRTYEPDLRAAARRVVGTSQDVDDVVQEALLRAFRGLGRFRGDSTLKTWLVRITRNAALDEVRRRNRRPAHALDDAEQAAGPDPIEPVAARHELAAALAALPPDQRAVVVLVDIEGVDYDAAARRLDVPKGTVASRLHRAHATLRRALADAATAA